MMRIGLHNLNGIRAALRRGAADFWAASGADVIALQEVRCQVKDLPEGAFGDRHVAFDVGTLPGRNGVALLTQTEPVALRTLSGQVHVAAPGGTPEEVACERIRNRELASFGHEGRYVEADLADAPLRVASLYLPKGAAWPYEPNSKDKYDRKMKFLKGLARHLTASRREAAAAGREFLIMGDFNIAHTELDLKNWRNNKKSEGFLPEEREWFTSILGPRTLIDVVRSFHPDEEGPYSWWSWRGQAFVNDSGWRIDYHLASPRLARSALSQHTAREGSYEARMSDHCPVLVDYDVPHSWVNS